MTNPADPFKRVPAMRANLMTCPQSQSFRMLMHKERFPRIFLAAFFISVVIHSLLAVLLWNIFMDHKAVKPEYPAVDEPLTLLLSTFTADPHDGPKREEITTEPQPEPPDEYIESSQEPSSGVEQQSEDETAETPEDNVFLVSDEPTVEPPAADENLLTVAVPSIDLKAAYKMEYYDGIMPDFKTDTVIRLKGEEPAGSKAPGNYFRTDFLAPSFGMESYYRLEKLLGPIPRDEIRKKRAITIMSKIDDYITRTRAQERNCKDIFYNKGLFAIPMLIKDAFSEDRCKWLPAIKELD